MRRQVKKLDKKVIIVRIKSQLGDVKVVIVS